MQIDRNRAINVGLFFLIVSEPSGQGVAFEEADGMLRRAHLISGAGPR
jgi:hypothetical protein